MPLTSPSSIGLDLEDFRRLGVRPHECRLTVIRRAAARSAKALAEKQLDAPSQQVGIQLSRVATSAYRLLDPRQRRDVSQRVHVGRILPSTLNGAGQTSFLNESQAGSVQSPFGQDSLDDEASVASTDQDSLSRSRNPDAAWTIVLNDDNPRDVRRRPKRFSRSRYPWVLLAVAGVAVGSILGMATLRYRKNELTLQRIQVPLASQAAAESQVTGNPPSPAEVATVPHPELTASVAESEATSTTASGTGITAPDVTALEVTAPEVTAPEVTAPIATTPMTETPPLASVDTDDPSASSAAPEKTAVVGHESASLSASEPDAEVEHSMLESSAEQAGTDGFIPDPFASKSSKELPPEMSEIAESDVTLDSDSVMPPDVTSKPTVDPTGGRHPVPEDSEIKAARQQLLALVPQLANHIPPKDVQRRIADIETILSDLSVGSVDDWTARSVIAELAWLAEDVSQVSGRLESLAENYDVVVQSPLAATFVAACDRASLPDTHQHLVDNGLRLANQLILSVSLEDCRKVVNAVRPSAEFLESESSLGYLEEFSKALDMMDRLAESANRVVDESGEIEAHGAEHGILGRYYCLMLRRWSFGLSWLAEASDSRIARVARQETSLGETPTAEELVSLSERWLSVASRSSGHVADSMRLHARDLLQQARPESSGLRELEIERTIDHVSELLPPFLRETRTPKGSLPAASPVTIQSNATPTPSSAAKDGLSGRLKIDGNDIGVQLDYELDVPLTQPVLDTIAQRLNRAISDVSIELAGEFEIDDPAGVVVSIAESRQSGTQMVWVDGTLLEFDPLDSSAEVSLQAGKHEIVWTIETQKLQRVYLRMHDAATGRRVAVTQGADASERRSILTVSLLRSAP